MTSGPGASTEHAPELRVPERRVLIVNQHGDNTGDESALRAMLVRLAVELGPTSFTVLHQFRERSSEVNVDQPVRWVPLRLPFGEALRLLCYTVSLVLGRPRPKVLGPIGRATIQAYETADLVVSAPGGPYFGDIYRSHEPVHWFYVWLARLHDAPTALYAPSAGPFATRWMNPLRRRTYRCFDVLTFREEQSAQNVRRLMGEDVDVEVTADSALSERVPPIRRENWPVGGGDARGRYLLVVSVIDAPYIGDPDPEARRRAHDDAIVGGVEHVAGRLDDPDRLHVVFVPQLRSRRHDDEPYLRRLADRLPATRSWEVLGHDLSSDGHRARFAAADLVLAGRYHPAVFALSAGVPVVCIAYEHKATGVMEIAGMSEFTTTLDEVDIPTLVGLLDRAMEDAGQVRTHLAEVEPELRRRSRRTAARCAALVLDGPARDGADAVQGTSSVRER